MAGYQYETSPRKIEYDLPKRPKKTKQTKKTKEDKKQKAIKLANKKAKKSIVVYSLLCFAILFGLIIEHAQISQSFNRIQILKNQIAEVEKENDQLEIAIQNELNLNNVESVARDNLGMQKLDGTQTRYINLVKKDYVSPTAEKIIIEESNIFTKIIDFIKNIF